MWEIFWYPARNVRHSEVAIAREEKNQWRFHRILIQLASRGPTNELEVSVAKGAHLHCSPFLLADVDCGVLMEQFRTC